MTVIPSGAFDAAAPAQQAQYALRRLQSMANTYDLGLDVYALAQTRPQELPRVYRQVLQTRLDAEQRELSQLTAQLPAVREGREARQHRLHLAAQVAPVRRRARGQVAQQRGVGQLLRERAHELARLAALAHGR